MTKLNMVWLLSFILVMPCSASLIHSWSLDEGSGVIAHDSVSGANCTLMDMDLSYNESFFYYWMINATPYEDKVGWNWSCPHPPCLYFIAGEENNPYTESCTPAGYCSGGYCVFNESTSNAPHLSKMVNMTACGWFMNSFETANLTDFYGGGDFIGEDTQVYFGLNNGSAGIGLERDGGLLANYTTLLDRNRWYHLCAVVENTTILRLYLNGSLVGVSYFPGGLPPGGSQLVYLGARNNFVNGHLRGSLDNILIYDQPLDNISVSNIYHYGTPTTTTTTPYTPLIETIEGFATTASPIIQLTLYLVVIIIAIFMAVSFMNILDWINGLIGSGRR